MDFQEVFCFCREKKAFKYFLLFGSTLHFGSVNFLFLFERTSSGEAWGASRSKFSNMMSIGCWQICGGETFKSLS